MAMKKAEMEEVRARYNHLLTKARTAEKEGRFPDALSLSLSACEHIDGMMQYERKFLDKDFSTVEALDLALKYAPLRLDHQALDSLEALLKDTRRIERNTSQSMADKLAAARDRMWEAYELLDLLGANNLTWQDDLLSILKGSRKRWEGILVSMTEMGLIDRSPDANASRLRVTLTTDLSKPVDARCSACGAVSRMPKREALFPQKCPRCSVTTDFVILSTNSAAAGK